LEFWDSLLESEKLLSLLELDETVDPALSIYVKTVVGTCSEAASKTSISF
jgi:hypothetical protein